MSSVDPAAGVVAYAPASIGNFAAGFDLLGACLAPLDGSLLGDLLEARPAERDEFHLVGPYASLLGGDNRPNLVVRTAGLYAEALAQRGLPCGPFRLTLEKRLPVSSGLGSSASSIVATLVALQALCDEALTQGELLEVAGWAESHASNGLHWDNVAPCLLGGLQLMVPGSQRPLSTRRLPWPEDLLVVVVHPDFSLPTAESRAVLPPHLSWADTVGFAGNLAGFVQGVHSRDRSLLARCLRDPLVEPHRASLVPGFLKTKAAALAAGAVGCSLSGSGPSIFAVAESERAAGHILDAIQSGFRAEGLENRGWICQLDPRGARLVNDQIQAPGLGEERLP